MPDLKWSYNAAIALRKWPIIRGPLKCVKRGIKKLKDATVEIVRILAPRQPRFGPPKTTFSVAAQIRAGSTRGTVLVEDQGNPKTDANSLLVLCKLSQHAEQPIPIFWSYHPKGRLVSTSLALLNELKEVAFESVYTHNWKPEDPAYRYFAIAQETYLEGNWTSLVSGWAPSHQIPTFSHWVLDALPRLKMLQYFPNDTKILIPARLAGYQLETLRLLGLQDRIRFTSEDHLVIEHFWFSSPTTMISCYNPYGVQVLRDLFLPTGDKNYTGPKRFIIQRKGKSRGIQNEEEVNAYFEKQGWAIIDTEKLTFAQEITLFSQAEAIAGVLGSGFTNCVWCNPGCVIFTFVADSFLDGWVEWISQVGKLSYFYRIFPSDHALKIEVDLKVVNEVLSQAQLLADSPAVG